MDKVCCRCKIPKDVSEFRPNKSKKDGLQYYCKECDKKFQQKWYEQNKDKVKEKTYLSNKVNRDKNIEFILEFWKGKSCKNCGNDNPIVLEFHHRDRTTKKGGISQMINSSWSQEEILQEINKCDILCSNCHKIETAKQFGYYTLKFLKE